MRSEEKNDRQEVRQEEPVRQQEAEKLTDEEMKQVNGGFIPIPAEVK